MGTALRFVPSLKPSAGLWSDLFIFTFLDVFLDKEWFKDTRLSSGFRHPQGCTLLLCDFGEPHILIQRV